VGFLSSPGARFCVDGLCLTCVGDSLYAGVRFALLKPSFSSESYSLPYIYRGSVVIGLAFAGLVVLALAFSAR